MGRTAALVALSLPLVFGVDVATFLAMNHSVPALWVLDGGGTEMLFVPQPQRTRTDCGYAASIDASGFAAAEGAVAVAAYIRPDTVSRFCLRGGGGGGGGVVDGPRSRRRFVWTAASAAPTLRAMAAAIEADPGSCLPSARGLLFEAVELLCFALGFKPVVLRQRLLKGGGGARNAVVHGAPGNLFSPHTKAVLAWLQADARDGVAVASSRNSWADSDEEDDPPFEESLVVARADGYLGAASRLVALRAQDASVPGQGSDDATAAYIAEVGRLLGYPRASVRAYVLGEMLVGFDPGRADAHLDAAAAAAGAFVVGVDRLPPLPGVDALLDAGLDAAVLADHAAVLDWLF